MDLGIPVPRFILLQEFAMSDEKAESAPADKAPGQMKLVIFCAVGAFVAALAGQVVAPMILGGGHQAAAPGEGHGEEGEEHDEAPLEPAQYVALDPPFVVSFDEEDGARYLQLQLQAMARDEKTIAAVKQHAPAIRNAFLFLLSGYELEALATQEGKEELRHKMLEAANEILAKNATEAPLEDLYFTSLVVQ
jgi:flagellar FliL protein